MTKHFAVFFVRTIAYVNLFVQRLYETPMFSHWTATQRMGKGLAEIESAERCPQLRRVCAPGNNNFYYSK